ncbi:VOC family protein [Clostridium uliginosum]|uniref:Catechol 2,3-dioxygenase n=1 Tax=Clostridium uliginosum TaxID=119641 RepID=A0A1I1P6I1_9CLOT|nr:VOC family protein [Clostridium uliginosum]SFD03258.1 Catechol 2,3-dioxygenase [Clostridium uliginosum]
MRFTCPLIAISDLEASKKFYQEVLGQKIVLDLGWNVTFSGGFAIQLNFADIVLIDKETIMKKSHNFELYFEEDDFDNFIEHLKKFDDIEYVHQPKKYDWQQRVVRIYDPDKHIIEIGESMAVIAKCYLNQGLSVEETANIIQHPVEFVKSCI